MILYHGSEYIIEKPLFGAGNCHNDYGLAFYCTKAWDLAAEWAVDARRDGYVNEYELNINNLSVLDLLSGEYSVLNWMAVLLENRVFGINSEIAETGKRFLIDNYHVPYSNYDVVIGWRADDSYFSYARAFLNNTISVETLEKAILLGNLGIQYAIKSKRGFDNIVFVSAKDAMSSVFYELKSKRDVAARNEYKNILLNRDVTKGVFLLDLMRAHK